MATVSPSRTDSNSRQGGENPNVTPAEPNSARLRDNSNTAGSGRERKASRQERIDDIFEAARARKLKLDQDSSTCSVQEGEADDPLSGPANQRTSSKKNNGERMDGSRREEAGTESSADEETHVFRRRGQGGDDEITMNYQSTAVNQNASQKTRKRGGIRNTPSTTSIRRRGMTHDPSQDAAGDEEDEHESWWARLLSNYGSLELENKGSVARDHLALERTFLAWLRTSLAFASIGIAITQLFRLNTAAASNGGDDPYKHLRQMGKPLGATFLAISIVMLGVGFHRYFESQHWIIRGKFPASRGSIALVAAITFALSVTSLVIVIVVEPGRYEKK